MQARCEKDFCRVVLTFQVLGLIMLLSVSSFAETTISARYLEPRGDHIQWKIQIPSPPPTAVIVIQYLPPGTEILETSHPISSYDQQKGIAKWLITPHSAGSLAMEMKLSRPILKKGEIRGEVMFKDDSQNTIASVLMKPRTMKKALEGC